MLDNAQDMVGCGFVMAGRTGKRAHAIETVDARQMPDAVCAVPATSESPSIHRGVYEASASLSCILTSFKKILVKTAVAFCQKYDNATTVVPANPTS